MFPMMIGFGSQVVCIVQGHLDLRGSEAVTSSLEKIGASTTTNLIKMGYRFLVSAEERTLIESEDIIDDVSAWCYRCHSDIFK